MDNGLRERHLTGITDENAIRLYDALIGEFESQYGSISEGAQHIIGDIAQMEQTKRALNEDIVKRGVVEEFRNGRQAFMRENKSISAARALAEQQRKHLNELKLTPASNKLDLNPEDEFNRF